MAGFMLNERLNRFFANEVELNPRTTKKITAKVHPRIHTIFRSIHDLDQHFGENADVVGSFYQGLKVQTADEFDYNIPFDIGTSLSWGPEKRMYFGFNDRSQNDADTTSDDLRLVVTNTPLPSPGSGYISVTLPYDVREGESLRDFTFHGFLIPFLVKRKCRQALDRVLQDQTAKDIRLSQMSHGPALTLTMDVSDGSELIKVDVDITVVIHARLPFDNSVGWPRVNARWPSKAKIDMIKHKGVSIIAKKNFHWLLSFAEVEKCLVQDIDKDGGCRKKVHRIMKMFLRQEYPNGKTTSCVLTSYMLKNAWLWECEDNPEPASWTEKHLSERFLGCIRRLMCFVSEGNLPQYFYPKINLLKGKDLNKMRQMVDEIYGCVTQ